MKDIPELETDEENWDNSQFDDAELLSREYSAYFEKVEDQEYSPYHTVQDVEYHIPELGYYHTNTQLKWHQRQKKTKMFIYPHLLLLKTFVHGTVEAKEEPDIWNCTVTDSMERKLGHSKVD